MYFTLRKDKRDHVGTQKQHDNLTAAIDYCKANQDTVGNCVYRSETDCTDDFKLVAIVTDRVMDFITTTDEEYEEIVKFNTKGI